MSALVVTVSVIVVVGGAILIGRSLRRSASMTRRTIEAFHEFQCAIAPARTNLREAVATTEQRWSTLEGRIAPGEPVPEGPTGR